MFVEIFGTVARGRTQRRADATRRVTTRRGDSHDQPSPPRRSSRASRASCSRSRGQVQSRRQPRQRSSPRRWTGPRAQHSWSGPVPRGSASAAPSSARASLRRHSPMTRSPTNPSVAADREGDSVLAPSARATPRRVRRRGPLTATQRRERPTKFVGLGHQLIESGLDLLAKFVDHQCSMESVTPGSRESYGTERTCERICSPSPTR